MERDELVDIGCESGPTGGVMLHWGYKGDWLAEVALFGDIRRDYAHH